MALEDAHDTYLDLLEDIDTEGGLVYLDEPRERQYFG